jgi:nitroimidazol reductase NimA-like FMN-containing flavoprotein (pyridoxamine 5'-phosphate oxidase superfamily)
MPAAHPVNYLLDDEEIVFRTGDGAKLAAAARGAVVGFQVDEIDVERRSGWSVLGVGEAYEIHDLARLAALIDRLPTPWAADRVGHCISIPLQRLTGRWLSAPE